MKKKNYIYTIQVADRNVYTTYVIRAANYAEAKEKAKAKFIKEVYDPKKITYDMLDKQLEF